jgi:hypothetical protein
MERDVWELSQLSDRVRSASLLESWSRDLFSYIGRAYAQELADTSVRRALTHKPTDATE